MCRMYGMPRAQHRKRAFNIDMETCERCQGPVSIIACVNDLTVIRQILVHLSSRKSADTQARLPPERRRRSHSRSLYRQGLLPFPLRRVTLKYNVLVFEVRFIAGSGFSFFCRLNGFQ